MTASDTSPSLENVPDAPRLIYGLRDTGYNFNTAAADIIDNSIAANASSPLGFLFLQVLAPNPFNLPIWLAGLYFYLFSRRG